MQVKQLKNTNATEVHLADGTILFSYSTPVAYWRQGKGYFRTNKKWSSTTSKHINKWLGGVEAKEVSQESLDSLVKDIRLPINNC